MANDEINSYRQDLILDPLPASQSKNEGDVDNDHKTAAAATSGPISAREYRESRSTTTRFLVTKFQRCRHVFIKFCKFVGPGALISVAYVDPDNFQTDISSGVDLQYKLLFMVLVANIIAVFLQVLCVKLGTVTGLNLAQLNRKYLPRWANISLWLLAEACMIGTDLGQVIGQAIAINLLIPKIPVIAGCAISVIDVLFILIFYRPDGSMRTLRIFEIFVVALLLGMIVCLCISLNLIHDVSAGEVWDGFVPSKDIFVSTGLYSSCALIGGNIMPHTLYLGTGLCQSRLRDYDVQHSNNPKPFTTTTKSAYRPTVSAIRSCLSYSVYELIIVLFVSAMFVNSAILIVGASSLSDAADDADFWGLYNLFQTSISRGAATIFALALLFSGVSCGIVATMAGQLVAEGALNWRMSPFFRRIVTRCIAIIPAIIIAAAVGRDGLSSALEATNYVLSVALIFVTAPLIWYTSFKKYMTVRVNREDEDDSDNEGAPVDPSVDTVSFANSWLTTIFGILTWVIITFLNIALWVLIGIGRVDNS